MSEPLSLARRALLAGAASAALMLVLAAGLPSRVLAQTDAGEGEGREIVEMAMGAEDAPVTVIEYASFTCPHCASFHAEVLPRLKETFIDPGKVRLVFREVYFDRYGLWAAMVARCAGPERYFGLADLLFSRQGQWAAADAPEAVVEELRAIGRQAGLSDDQMTECLTDFAFAEGLVAEYQKNAAADDVTATPSFVINGEKASNMSYGEFEARLNQELGL